MRAVAVLLAIVVLLTGVAEAQLMITGHPTGANVYVGGSVTLSVTAAGNTGTLHYTWKRDVEIVGADSASLTLDPVTLAEAGTYFCEVSDDLTMVESNSAFVDVAEHLAITQQPTGGTVLEGQPFTFTVGVSGGFNPISYQWSKGGQPVTDATTATLNLAAVAQSDAGSYTCEVGDGNSDVVVSDAATLLLGTGSELQITAHPQSATLDTGQSYTLSVTVDGGVPPYTYEWFKDEVSLGAGASELTFNSITLADGGDYYCVISDSDVSAITTNVATLAVSEPFVITQQPVGGTVNVGGNFSMSVTVAGGNPPYGYLWIKDSDVIADATTATYELTSVTLGDAADYTCYVSDSTSHSQFSDAATLTVLAPPIVIETEPESATVNVGQSATFTVAASGGTGALSYAWFKDNVPVGTNLPSLTIGYVTITDGGSYWCVVEDEADGLATSATALLTVTQNTDTVPPVISLNGANPLILQQNQPYTEAGATAADDVDGDISDRIIISGEVDTTVVGTGEVFYLVADTAGNTTTRSRLVFVDPLTPATAEVGEDGGDVWVPGVTLDIPPGALLESTTVTLVRAAVPPLSAPLNIGVMGAAGCYSVGGLSGAVAPVIFTFYYADTDNDGIVDGTDRPETDLVVLIVDRDGCIHVLRGEVATSANTVTVTIPLELLPNLKGPDDVYAILGYENGATVPLQALPVAVVLLAAGMLRLRRRK